MEVLLPMSVGLAAFAGLSVLLATGTGDVLRSGGRLAFLVSRRASRVVRRVAGTRPVAALLGTELGRRMAREAQAQGFLASLGLGGAEALAALLMGIGLASAASSVLFLTPLAFPVVACALCALVVARDAARRQRMRREVLAEMPGIYRTLAVAMGSGQTLSQAVDYVGSHERGPASGVFARMSLRLRCGVATEEAVASLAEELDVPGARLLAAALVISHRTGSPLRDLLLRSARLAERQGEFERMLVVKTAQVRLSVRIVCLLPVVMVGVLSLVSPDFQQGLFTPSGAGCVLLAMVLDGAALLLIRRLIRGVM
ncbi:type II secretion system F family protein [Thermophilibacter sp. ET337]|uniref:type II secretion system F family protein n=1 Tax=Thermophilibacter sp. ET337 TaxID=2973084 RepID=UPI0021ABAE1F|nr:type II secretion system F family protein [Thermophilibacter sp. ET337]MCR8907739.1 type II secretion system F family protein [Thermophilibacter sp. ET337]